MPSLLFQLCLFCAFPAVHLSFAAQPDSSDWIDTDIKRMEKVDQTQPFSTQSLLFIGSSNIRNWRTLVRDLSPLHTLSRAIPGVTLPELNRVAGKIVTPYRPVAVILLAGEDDIAAGGSPEEVLGEFKRFVTEVRKVLPGEPIVFVSILPSPARWNLWTTMQRANTLVREYTAQQKGILFLDVTSLFLDKGGIVRTDLFIGDRLTLNGEGHRILTETLKPRLTDLLKSLPASQRSAPRQVQRSLGTPGLAPQPSGRK
jgi:hypothetical protein